MFYCDMKKKKSGIASGFQKMKKNTATFEKNL